MLVGLGKKDGDASGDEKLTIKFMWPKDCNVFDILLILCPIVAIFQKRIHVLQKEFMT